MRRTGNKEEDKGYERGRRERGGVRERRGRREGEEVGWKTSVKK